jgi:hypothetical protein
MRFREWFMIWERKREPKPDYTLDNLIKGAEQLKKDVAKDVDDAKKKETKLDRDIDKKRKEKEKQETEEQKKKQREQKKSAGQEPAWKDEEETKTAPTWLANPWETEEKDHGREQKTSQRSSKNPKKTGS